MAEMIALPFRRHDPIALTELAARSGVSETYLQDLAAGRRRLHPEVQRLLARSLRAEPAGD